MRTVFLARHGETEWNIAGRPQGQLDSPLTERGRGQGRSLARLVASLPIDAIFASPLGRAQTTAAFCADALNLDVTTLDSLAEVHHGQFAGLTAAEQEANFPGARARRVLDKYPWRFPGGESYSDADLRACDALTQIAATHAQAPLVVSHEMFGRMLRRHLFGAGPDEALAWTHPHDVVFMFEVVSRHVTELRS